MSLCGRLSGWAIWAALVACTLAPRPQTAPPATAVAPAQAAPARNVGYVRPEDLRSDVVWPDPQFALKWQLAPEGRDLPPAKFDHNYDGQVIVFDDLNAEQIGLACAKSTNIPLGRKPIACGTLGVAGKPCIVWLPNAEIQAANRTTRENLLRHEIGHCNGWPGDHRGARTWREAEH